MDPELDTIAPLHNVQRVQPLHVSLQARELFLLMYKYLGDRVQGLPYTQGERGVCVYMCMYIYECVCVYIYTHIYMFVL